MAKCNVTPSHPAARRPRPRRQCASQGRRSPAFRDQLHPPPGSVASAHIFTAVVIALRYARRTPTVGELVQEFGMHPATAYRWRGAIAAAKGER